jgi:hypothetical protein
MDALLKPLLCDPTVGERTTHKEHDRVLAERQKKWRESPVPETPDRTNVELIAQYQQRRGK